MSIILAKPGECNSSCQSDYNWAQILAVRRWSDTKNPTSPDASLENYRRMLSEMREAAAPAEVLGYEFSDSDISSG
jgi:hypothetical protein